MTADEREQQLIRLATLGKRMRELQKQYFRSRDRSVLIESKQAEKQFDQAIAEVSKETS